MDGPFECFVTERGQLQAPVEITWHPTGFVDDTGNVPIGLRWQFRPGGHVIFSDIPQTVETLRTSFDGDLSDWRDNVPTVSSPQKLTAAPLSKGKKRAREDDEVAIVDYKRGGSSKSGGRMDAAAVFKTAPAPNPPAPKKRARRTRRSHVQAEPEASMTQSDVRRSKRVKLVSTSVVDKAGAGGWEAAGSSKKKGHSRSSKATSNGK